MRRTIKFKALNEARVFFSKDNVLVKFSPLTQTFDIILMVILSCSESDWQLSSAAQACTSSFSTVYMVEHIYVDEDRFFKTILAGRTSTTRNAWSCFIHLPP